MSGRLQSFVGAITNAAAPFGRKLSTRRFGKGLFSHDMRHETFAVDLVSLSPSHSPVRVCIGTFGGTDSAEIESSTNQSPTMAQTTESIALEDPVAPVETRSTNDEDDHADVRNFSSSPT